jgi:hypothetical protein
LPTAARGRAIATSPQPNLAGLRVALILQAVGLPGFSRLSLSHIARILRAGVVTEYNLQGHMPIVNCQLLMMIA